LPENVRESRRIIRSIVRIVRLMMYGFGDAEQPREDSIEVMEECMIDYVVQLVHFYREMMV